MKKEKKKPVYGMWSNTCFMLKLAWKHQKNVIGIVVVLTLLSVTSSVLNLYVTPSVLHLVEVEAPLLKLIIAIVLFSGALLLISALSSYINTNELFPKVKIRLVLVMMIQEKFATTSYPNIQNQDFIKLIDRAKRSVGSNVASAEAIWNTLKAILEHGIGFVIYLVLLCSVNWVIVVVTLITSVISYVIGKKTNEWQYNHMEEGSALSNQMGYLEQMGQDRAFGKDIRIFGIDVWLQEMHEKTIKLYDAFWVKGEKIRFIGNLTDVLFAFLRNGVAYGYLLWLVLENGLTASEFLLYFSAVGGFTSWITGIMGDFATLHNQSLDLSIVRECLEWKELFLFEDGEPLHLQANTPCEIQLKNVTFTYPEASESIIKNINLTIHAGEKFAIVGLNGAGKTTLVKLICGFLDPDEGEVLLNGVDIRRYNRRDYYKYIVAIFQQFSVLSASVEENVAQSTENIDREKVKHCIEQAGLSEVIARLPQQYETKIGKEVYEDGVELSGGEMQRLMLARTIYKEAPIMVLDEPTSALDPLAESEMYQRYNELTKGRTSVYISHRLASTRFCDRIILLENGSIKEEGNHEQLIAKKGTYAELFEIQSHYYQEEV